MRLATLKDGSRDGVLLLVSRDHQRAVRATGIASTLQAALDDWRRCEPALKEMAALLEAGKAPGSFALDLRTLHAPLPRAYQWVDGSAYINHVVLVRKARNAEPPETLRTDPLMYQGGSDSFLAPYADIEAVSEAHGIDFESEVVVITDDVPMGVTPEAALGHIRLVTICNDVSLRNLIPTELAKGFGFLTSKPATAFAPIAVTPDELGDAWRGGRLHLPLETRLNGELFGNPDAGPEMHFHFGQLIAHVAATRHLAAGTIVGSGTVSNEDRAKGSSCLAEKRMLEIIDTGKAVTPFMRFGDHVRIEMRQEGRSVFGAIEQKVVRYDPDRAGR